MTTFSNPNDDAVMSCSPSNGDRIEIGRAKSVFIDPQGLLPALTIQLTDGNVYDYSVGIPTEIKFKGASGTITWEYPNMSPDTALPSSMLLGGLLRVIGNTATWFRLT